MEAYKMGIIDRQEVLKKTEIFDFEGVMQRTDEIQQLKSALEQAQEEIKKLSGDLQTAQREVMHSNMRTINAQYESKLKGNELENQKQTELYTARASDSLANLNERVNIELQKEKLKMSANKQTNKKNK
jgi:monoamine oxidase